MFNDTAVTPTAGQSYALMCCSQQNYSSEYLICWIPEPSTCVHTLHSTPRLYLPRGYTTVTREADAANDVDCKCGTKRKQLFHVGQYFALHYKRYHIGTVSATQDTYPTKVRQLSWLLLLPIGASSSLRMAGVICNSEFHLCHAVRHV